AQINFDTTLDLRLDDNCDERQGHNENRDAQGPCHFNFLLDRVLLTAETHRIPDETISLRLCGEFEFRIYLRSTPIAPTARNSDVCPGLGANRGWDSGTNCSFRDTS